MVGEVHTPIPASSGHGKIVDYEHACHGAATLSVEVEPLDWAGFIKAMLSERYPAATKVPLIMDNLNIHSVASLYETFPPAET